MTKLTKAALKEAIQNEVDRMNPDIDLLTTLKIVDILDTFQDDEQSFPDVEADGYVYCGKCGKLK